MMTPTSGFLGAFIDVFYPYRAPVSALFRQAVDIAEQLSRMTRCLATGGFFGRFAHEAAQVLAVRLRGGVPGTPPWPYSPLAMSLVTPPFAFLETGPWRTRSVPCKRSSRARIGSGSTSRISRPMYWRWRFLRSVTGDASGRSSMASLQISPAGPAPREWFSGSSFHQLRAQILQRQHLALLLRFAGPFNDIIFVLHLLKVKWWFTRRDPDTRCTPRPRA